MTDDDSPEATNEWTASDERGTSGTGSTGRRELLGLAGSAGFVTLAGCTVSREGVEVAWGGDSDGAAEAGRGEGDDPGSEAGESGEADDEDDETDDNDDEDDETDDEAETEDGGVVSTVSVYDVELTAVSEDMTVGGRILVEGVYDGGTVLPVDHDDREIWYGDMIPLEVDDPREFDVDARVDFPEDAIEDVDESEPHLLVRGEFADLNNYDQTMNRYDTTMDTARVFLKPGSVGVYDDQELAFFFEGGTEVRMTFSVAPVLTVEVTAL